MVVNEKLEFEAYTNNQNIQLKMLQNLLSSWLSLWKPYGYDYRSGTVNSKSFVGKVLLRIKQKFDLINAL